MNTTFKVSLIVIAVLFGAAILVTGGLVLGRMLAFRNTNAFNPFNNSVHAFDYRPSMMEKGFFGQAQNNRQSFSMGSGMMEGGFFDRRENNLQTGMRGFGMMGQGLLNNTYSGDPVSIETAQTAFETYLKGLSIEGLELHEIMIFSQNAYASVTEKDSGKGAMELLLDYSTNSIYPEPGPNHMWNLKYGRMSVGQNTTFRCGMGCQASPSSTTLAEMTVSETEARTTAQAYLDANEPGAVAADDGVAFYGYYTFDYSQDGKVVGMLSVNGYNTQVWPHTWHGQFFDELEIN